MANSELMTNDDAFIAGFTNGKDAALNTDYDPVTDESLEGAAHGSEQNARQYADFVNGIGRDIMDAGDEEIQTVLWEFYDAGVEAGVGYGLLARKYTEGLTND